jgi:DNA mismatch repair protein MutS
MSSRSTPMMRQYLAMKEKVRDAVLLFRMGDFYEMFFEDAEMAARELGLTLTTRDKGKLDPVPMAGVPHHAVDGYIARLVRRGHRVAVCDQVEDPGQAKGLVAREVTQVVTAGTALSDALLTEGRNNYVAAVRPDGARIGFAAADVSTGAFLLEDLSRDTWRDAVEQISIAEWIVPESHEEKPAAGRGACLRRPDAWFDLASGRDLLLAQFGRENLEQETLLDLEPALGAGGALLHYLKEVQSGELRHLVRARRFGAGDVLVLDTVTRRNLELFGSIQEEGDETSLLRVLDHTVTSPGARRLRSWLERPLLSRSRIVERQDAVGELLDRSEESANLLETLRRFRDLERLLGKCATGRAGPRDLRALADGALATPVLKERLGWFRSERFVALAARCPDLSRPGGVLDAALVEAPVAQIGEGGVFREGWNAELDELSRLARGGKEWMTRIQEEERARTGIANLRVGYNKVFGYYLEVTAAHRGKIPEHYLRKQTLVNAERYATAELKEAEEKILGAEERRGGLERRLFAGLVEEVLAEASSIQRAAEVIAEADALLSLARAARENRYVRPEIVEEPVVSLAQSRHPVLERLLPPGEFVPNDLDLDGRSRQIAVITGPNMAGKSTYLRQVGLIAVMSQMGSFVPASQARIGIVDRVFTRVGASDNIARGRSTFMVEMEETATILDRATDRSLVLLDEIGRGTSTYDGLSIAWAVTEHLHERREGRPRTLFATHYHELTALPEQLARARNLTVLVKEWNGKVIFLRQIVEGAADRSYGIHVAELAGLPPAVVARARAILATLERGHPTASSSGAQLTLFEPVGSDLLEELGRLDPDTVTPLEALRLLTRWKERYGNGGA